MILLRSFTCLVFTVTIAGCANFSHSIIQKREHQYLKATSTAALTIPPTLSSDSFHNDYPIADHHYPERSKQVSLLPPGL